MRKHNLKSLSSSAIPKNVIMDAFNSKIENLKKR